MYIMKKIIIIELWFLIDTKVLAWMYCCVDVYSNYTLLYVYWYVYYDFTRSLYGLPTIVDIDSQYQWFKFQLKVS